MSGRFSANGHRKVDQHNGEKNVPASRRQQIQKRLQEVRGALKNIPAAFRLVWESNPKGTLAMAGLTLAGAFVPAAQAWVGKLIVDAVVTAIRNQVGAMAGLRAVLPFLALEFGLLLASTLIGQLRSLTEHILHAQMNYHINTQIILKALSLDLSFFENTEFYDKLQKARQEADWRALRIMNGAFYLVQNILTLLSFGALMVSFSPLLPLILVTVTVPAFIAQSHFAELHFRLLSWRAPEARRLNYFEYLLSSNESAKEVKLFELGPTLLGRYRDLFWRFFEEDTRLVRQRMLVSFGFGLIANLTYYGSYAWIVLRAVSGAVTLGSMTMLLSVFRQSQSMFQAVFSGLSDLYEHSLFMSNLFAFLELQPTLPVARQPRPVPRPIRRGIEFRNVSFRYPGIEVWALRDVNLQIGAGEKIALVGANGAGKTTLIKLLTRLYDPTEGQILIDGIDLREFDPKSLHAVIGVIFQDFVRYHLTVRENIGFGQVDKWEDVERVTYAAERSGAAPVVAGLPEGYDTMLGRWFGQHELSGGEWQKIALARAFMREAEVLVLDEPTSSLDAETEYAVFQRFRELTEERIAVLISHRFSTVRMADRIAVIQDGHISELGSHAELMALGGTYARMFNMQAEGYR